MDEYQDLNRCEIEVVRHLAAAGPDLFAAGDDDQSIYAFRNAFPLGLREFGRTHPATAELELEVCHRCDEDILALGIAVAEQDINRIPKALRARDDAAPGEVNVYRFRNITEEAEGIANVCERFIQAGLRPADILILLRNNPQRVYSDPIVAALGEVGLLSELPQDPFAVFNEDGPRQLQCLLRLLRERDDGLAWRELHTARGSYDEDERAWPVDRVRIMSMHSAKGLTSPAVIIAACEDELLPGELQERRDLDDQRRLLYVSLTRAEHFLTITYAARRAGRQSTILQAPEARTLTRFLRDLVRAEELD